MRLIVLLLLCACGAPSEATDCPDPNTQLACPYPDGGLGAAWSPDAGCYCWTDPRSTG